MISDFKGHHFVEDFKPGNRHHGITANDAE
jgi:hypothetical protein